MTELILLAITGSIALAAIIIKTFYSNAAKAKKLQQAVWQKEKDLSYVTEKMALATRTRNYSVRNKLNEHRLQLINELDRLRKQLEFYKRHSA